MITNFKYDKYDIRYDSDSSTLSVYEKDISINVEIFGNYKKTKAEIIKYIPSIIELADRFDEVKERQRVALIYSKAWDLWATDLEINIWNANKIDLLEAFNNIMEGEYEK